MIQSMTGFGKSVVEIPGKKIIIEIKTLNSKQLDLNTRIPGIYREKELEIRNLLSKIERGKVECFIFVENVDKTISSQINLGAVESYYKQISSISSELNIPMPSDWYSVILRLPETIKTEICELDENEWDCLKQGIVETIDKLVEFRIQEGNMLEKIFLNNINNIDTLLKEVDKYEPERLERVKKRITDSLQKLEATNYDENRFEQEMIYYIEKLDVNEEKSRLKNHLDYFIETMKEETAQGRKLGFISQEIGREINTLGSKSNHADMQKIVVQMKDELEQIKEQVLNVL